MGGGTSKRTAPDTQNPIGPPLYIQCRSSDFFAAHALEKPLLLLRNAFVELECRMQNRVAVIGLDLPAVNAAHDVWNVVFGLESAVVVLKNLLAYFPDLLCTVFPAIL